MKYIKIQLVAALIIFSLAAFAQDSTSQKTNNPKQQTANIVYTCPMHADVVSDKPGKCPKCGMTLVKSIQDPAKKNTGKIYTCTMHPEITSDKPGKCPKCHMKLVEKVKDDPKK